MTPSETDEDKKSATVRVALQVELDEPTDEGLRAAVGRVNDAIRGLKAEIVSPPPGIKDTLEHAVLQGCQKRGCCLKRPLD